MGASRELELRYACDRTALPARLAEAFVQLDADASTQAWIEQARSRPHAAMEKGFRTVAGWFMSDFDANGWLGMHDMRVLGAEQWRLLFGERPGGALLDVGAGDGLVTRELATLFDTVTATETSRPMVRRLRRRGYEAHHLDLAHGALPGRPVFDAACLLNVLDRTNEPRALLSSARGHLRAGGWLVVATPLPFRPLVYEGSMTVDPDEWLPVAGESFEDSVAPFVTQVLEPEGLHVHAWTRAPYLCRGGSREPVLVLDDAVFVCRAQRRGRAPVPTGDA